MKKTKKKQPKVIQHKLGDKHFVDGLACIVKFVNAGSAWLFPEINEPGSFYTQTHIAFAKVDEYGNVTIRNPASKREVEEDPNENMV